MEADKVREFHDNLLDKLLEWRGNDDSKTFCPRRINKGRRLENGFWFHGNERFL